MRAVLQRVKEARVTVASRIVGEIGLGIVALIGVGKGDTGGDADRLCDKIVHLRIFNDSEGRMNRSVVDVGGGILAVSNFTVYGDTRRGHRPSFDAAAPAGEARRLYEYLVARLSATGLRVACGVFQAEMRVTLVNDGPVTVICESGRPNSPDL